MNKAGVADTCASRRACLRAAGVWTLGAIGAIGSTTARAATPEFSVERRSVSRVPDVPLVTMQGRRTSLGRELETDEAVWLNFVFTTCSTTCSMQTAVLAALQARLAREARRARFVSLTIDPDNDTPAQLAQFAGRFGIRADWQFCTGRFEDLLQPQQAFDVYRGSKASHPPVVMLRTARAAPWWRISGFPSADDLYGVLASKRGAS